MLGSVLPAHGGVPAQHSTFYCSAEPLSGGLAKRGQSPRAVCCGTMSSLVRTAPANSVASVDSFEFVRHRFRAFDTAPSMSAPVSRAAARSAPQSRP